MSSHPPMIKRRLARMLETALGHALAPEQEKNAASAPPPAVITVPQDPLLGDYCSDVALVLARSLRDAARGPQIARQIVEQLPGAGENDLLASASVAGNGFINLRLAPGVLPAALRNAVAAGPAWGQSGEQADRRVLVEFVSANPHEPITVEHGRGGVVGDVLANLASWTGGQAHREFYVNDWTSRAPLSALVRAVWARCRQLVGHNDAPGAGGEAESAAAGAAQIDRLARQVLDQSGAAYAERLSFDEASETLAPLVAGLLRADQEKELADFGVRFDTWFLESALHERGAVVQTLRDLEASGHTEQRGGALWLRSTRRGDAVDRVLVRADGRATYLAGDLAYHRDKLEARGFERVIDVWDADHAAYVDRTRAGLAALQIAPERLRIVVYGPVRLLRDGTEVSQRAGSVSLAELVGTIGRDAARFFLLSRAPGEALDLDLDLAQRGGPKNPLGVVRDALARCKHRPLTPLAPSDDLSPLGGVAESRLLKKLLDLPHEIVEAADNDAPHRLAGYALDLAHDFSRFADENDPAQTPAHQLLAGGVGASLASALAILGISLQENHDAF